MEEVLQEVQQEYSKGMPLSRLLPQMRQLAQARYEPAIDFLAQAMGDRRVEWRLQCMHLLAGEYDPTYNENALDAFRQRLLQDPQPQLRLKAAEYLALYTTWPDAALLQALNSEQEVKVSFTIFEAILSAVGVPRNRIRDEVADLYSRRQRPSLQEVERISQRVANQQRTPHAFSPGPQTPSTNRGPERQPGPGGVVWLPAPE